MTAIVIATVTVGVVGILIGVLLGIASEVFKVEVDEKEIQVREALPGNNCGACGYPGCDGLAKAIAGGEAKINQCPVGGQPVAEKIAVIMGVREIAIILQRTIHTQVCMTVTVPWLYRVRAVSLVNTDVWDTAHA